MRLLTDPVFRRRVTHLRRQVPPPGFDLRRPVDAVLLSHAHFDHLDLPTLREFDRGTTLLAPAGTGSRLRRAGFTSVRELEPGETAAVGGRVRVRAVPAVHDGRRHPWAKDDGAIGFEIIGSRRLYFAGDTDVFPEMEAMAGRLDLALLPIWGWGHRLGPGHMDPRGAARAATLLRPALTVPIHWGTYFPVGMKRIRGGLLEKPVTAFADQMDVLAPELEKRILRPGESLLLPGASS